jgi:hypothetical protein
MVFGIQRAGAMRSARGWFGGVAVVVLAASAVVSADWPHWRGPSATGIAAPSALPSTWSASQNIAWQAALEGVSSPIVSGNRVFVTSQAGDGRRRAGNHPTLTQGGDPAAAGELKLQRPSTALGAGRSRTDVHRRSEKHHTETLKHGNPLLVS